MSEKVELKPCPFCGGDATLYHYRHDRTAYQTHKYTVECPTCGASVPFYNTEEKALEIWNRRTKIE